MKILFLSLLLLLFFSTIQAQNKTVGDTTIHIDEPDENSKNNNFQVVESAAEFPGGIGRFYSLITSQIRFREVQQLIGISGKVKVQFEVGTNGKLTNIKALSNIGSGCEQDVVHAIANSPWWLPARQNNRLVVQRLVIPIAYNIPKDTIRMAELRAGACGYLFRIKDAVYTVDQAAKILGETFSASFVELATIYEDPEKFDVKKNEIWLVKIKN
jgi:hypothetical protein